MMRSEITRGKIEIGATQLASTITVIQTAPLQLTVKEGTFTHTDGRAWILANDAIFSFTTDAVYPIECKIEIGYIAGMANVWCGTRLLDGIEEMNPPLGWNTGHVLIFPFVISPNTTDLSAVDIFVLTVVSGFP